MVNQSYKSQDKTPIAETRVLTATKTGRSGNKSQSVYKNDKLR